MSKPPIDGNAVIPSDWEGDYCQYGVCWPNSPQWLAVLRGQLIEPANGRFWRASTGVIVTAQDTIKETFDHNLHLEEIIMACTDASELAAALNAIAVAITNSSGGGSSAACCGSGGTAGGGSTPAEPTGVDTGGLTPSEDPPPGDYPTWEAFEIQRCGVATQIVQKLQQSLGNMVILSIGGLSFAGLIEILIVMITLTISTAGIAAIAALVLTLSSTIIIATCLSIINDGFDDFVCALLRGSDSLDSITEFRGEFAIRAEAGIADVVERFLAEQLMAYMVGLEETNRMYTQNTSIDYSNYSCFCTPDCLTGEDIADGYSLPDLEMASLVGIDGISRWTTQPDFFGDDDRASIGGMNHTIEAGDVWSFCFLDDPGGFGAKFVLELDGDEELVIDEGGTIVDHVAARCYSLDNWIGREIKGFTWWVHKFGGGTWDITAIGLNCVCTESASCWTVAGPA